VIQLSERAQINFSIILHSTENKLYSCTPIFTHGSKQNNHTATAVVLISQTITKRLPNSASIYTAELYAILLALNKISKQHKYYISYGRPA